MIQLTVNIHTCQDCRHKDHSGGFTPGGAKDICRHPNAVNSFARGLPKPERYNWEHRVIDVAKEPPRNCPLRSGNPY